MTNFEKIKAMGVDELAEILDAIDAEGCCIMPKISCCHDCFFCKWCGNKNLSSKEWLESQGADDD